MKRPATGRPLLRAFLWSALLLGASTTAVAITAGERPTFDDPAKAALYDELLGELRCTVCQNQSLRDSNASLAQDLRRQIHDQIRAGRNRDQIEEYLVSRYGDYVLYRPPLRPATVLLWGGPALLLLAGAAFYLRILRRHHRRDTGLSEGLTPREREALQELERRYS